MSTKRHISAKKSERDAMLQVWLENENEYSHCQCEECGRTIKQFDPSNLAHAWSKGAAPQYRADVRNLIVLCFPCHQVLDFGAKSSMKIYPKVQNIIMTLKLEASGQANRNPIEDQIEELLHAISLQEDPEMWISKLLKSIEAL